MPHYVVRMASCPDQALNVMNEGLGSAWPLSKVRHMPKTERVIYSPPANSTLPYLVVTIAAERVSAQAAPSRLEARRMLIRKVRAETGAVPEIPPQ